jgi:hypothetical protein
VPNIKIGLGAIIGNKNLAMLKWIHGARIDIEIGIELLHGDADSASYEKAT